MPADEIVVWNRRLYPSFLLGDGTRTFCVPIRAEYHERLFPERSCRVQTDFFRGGPLEDAINRTPGNTIRKVYLCRAQTRRLRPGDLLVFYVSKDTRYIDSQCVTTLGVVDRVADASTLDEVVRATARRSVFSLSELEQLVNAAPAPLKVIDFLLVSHLQNPIGLTDLMESGVLRGPPQTIVECRDAAGARLHQGLSREVATWG